MKITIETVGEVAQITVEGGVVEVRTVAPIVEEVEEVEEECGIHDDSMDDV